MDAQDLVERMQKYGLDEAEARLYYHLSKLGPSRAAAVAQAAGRKRTDAYRLLDHLVKKGFAEKSLERPARYIPRSPDEALKRALQVRREQTDTLEAGRAELASAWPRVIAAPQPAKQRFTVHQGRAQVNGLLGRMVASAREQILLATTADGLSRLDLPALRDALKSRAEAGVLVRVLSRRGQGTLPLEVEGIQVRYADLPTFYQAVLVDSREVALFVAAGKGISGNEETVLWLNSSDVALAQQALFDKAWMQALGPGDLEGPTPRQVQVLRGRWVRGSRLKEMVQGAAKSIAIRAPAGEVERWKRQGILQALAAKAKEGVDVSLHLPPDAPTVAGATTMTGPTGNNLVAVVDGIQVLLALGAGNDPDAAHDEGEWSIWSTHPDFPAFVVPNWETVKASRGARP
jgi:sugar-specific transcriptional regulator TrmB